MDNIEHVVVLMLENRSFDSLMGWLYEHDLPARNIPAAKEGDEFRGLSGLNLAQFINRADNGLSSPPIRGVDGFSVPSVAPGEEFEHVNMQFFGTKKPGPDAKATMTGVLQDFVNVMRSLKYDEGLIRETASMIMQTYTPQQLPILSQLARHYAVSDNWFSSVPSQTNPNRAFLMTGTSHGLVNNGQLETSPYAKDLEKIIRVDFGDDRFPENTIFNALDSAGFDWAVFFQTSYLPQKIATLTDAASRLGPLLNALPKDIREPLKDFVALLQPYRKYINELTSGDLTSSYTWRLFPAIQEIEGARQNFRSLDQFHKFARAGRLPKFSYIEPCWTISHDATNDGTFAKFQNLVTQIGNDYHPPGNMIVAENFVKDIYSSLIDNQAAWNKTLLVITFDEFVGSFDHVPPPAAVPPWRSPPTFPTHGFDFKRYGARVPTILVSPWVEKGTVFRSTTKVPYDHTSVIATTLKWLGQDGQIESFGQRVAGAPTFENVLTRGEARTDAGDIGFLNVIRKIGDPVRFGDLIRLKNQKHRYVTTSSRTLLAVGSLLPESLMGFAVDLNVAAYFPTVGNDTIATLSFQATKASQTDASSQVADGASLFIVTQESGVGAANFLGAWRNSHDCYYYNNYAFGDYVQSETWIVKQADQDRAGKSLCYGDSIYIETNSIYYAGQRLSQDTRYGQGQWLTTVKQGNGGDCWTIEPAITDGL
nr:alkaline phosphatase family protein [Burkholderia ubonensis]